jgi:hypothetical protein
MTCVPLTNKGVNTTKLNNNMRRNRVFVPLTENLRKIYKSLIWSNISGSRVMEINKISLHHPKINCRKIINVNAA